MYNENEKRSIDGSEPPQKKVRLWSTENFRNRIRAKDKVEAIQEFFQLCSNDTEGKYITEYLKQGGSCMELFQLLGSETPAVTILGIVNKILLHYIDCDKLDASVYNSCQYFLQTHLASISKMLSLGSPRKERRIILQLLTSIVTFSKKLAKEILLHVNFNSANVEVLAKQAEQTDSVRNAFIHFIMAFFVECDYSIVNILLDKKYMLLSIFKGLLNDPADTVVLVMNTLRIYMLETVTINKTTKMNIFNTNTVKDIVNLYNWKGPYKNVELYEKNLVNVSVHNFLLILCTSHKYGVIFRDPHLGLGKKSYNNLMYTVVDSLERPWEHSYAGELVTKICGACPDLAKIVWTNLNSFLEPRSTEKWFKTIKYATDLVEELQQTIAEINTDSLTVAQLVQMVTSILVPQSVLKTIIPENRTYEKGSVRFHCILLIKQFVKAVQHFCIIAQNRISVEENQSLKSAFNEFFYRNFLTAKELLTKDWTDEDDLNYSNTKYLEVVLDVLNLYEILCPQLLDTMKDVSLCELLTNIDKVSDNTRLIKIRAILLFVNFEPSAFEVSSKIFESSLSLALLEYCQNRNRLVYGLLHLLLKNLGIFEDCVEEIDIWINSFFCLSEMNDVLSIFIQILKHTCNNILTYISVGQKLIEDLHEEQHNYNLDILESLVHNPWTSESTLPIRNNRLGPLLIGTLEYLENVEQNKNLKIFLNSIVINLLHFQTSPNLLQELIFRKQHLITKPIVNYVIGWKQGTSTLLTKTKLRTIENFNVYFLTSDIDHFYKDLTETDSSNFLYEALFYFTQLNEDVLKESHLENCVKVCERSPLDALGAAVFRHPILVRRFSPVGTSITNRFLAKIVNLFENADIHLKPFRDKLTRTVQTAIRKRKPLAVFENLTCFGLDHYQCIHLLEISSTVELVKAKNDFLKFYYNLIAYLLKSYLTRLDYTRMLSTSVFSSLANFIAFLNTKQIDSSDCIVLFQTLLEHYPHGISLIPSELFRSMLNKEDFCNKSAIFAGFLLKQRSNNFIPIFESNYDKIVTRKGLILPLLESAISIDIGNATLQNIYQQFEPTILKGLEKPLKAGPYFDKYNETLTILITRFMSKERCTTFVKKVQKFETAEVFHVKALIRIFNKLISEDIEEKYVCNTIITLIYSANLLFKKREKSDEDWLKLETIVQLSTEYYQNISLKQMSCRSVRDNDAFSLHVNYCLKYGLSGKSIFLRVIHILTRFLNISENEAQNILNMVGSHSEFLEIALGYETECKKQLFELILVLCERWPSLVQRNHMPVLLSAYHGTMGGSDRIILVLLQLYEKMTNQSNFYDFKPFLWGKAGAAHYSVRQDIQRALWRQPRMLDILEILEENKVNNTINSHPLNLTLTNSNNEAVSSNENVYNLAFFLPLFGSLLTAENQVALHTFVKSGSLSLTILGLSCNNKRVRLASCHVLSRLHYHLEAKNSGKDKILRLCFIESLCRGLAVLEDFKLNNFCSIFWARMALILLRPLHPMYLHLSRYLTAKPTPDLSGIPEFYTFLHIPDVNYKEPKKFILKILQDGMRTNSDFSVLIFKMGFKLLMELFSSCISDLDTKIAILKIIKKACLLDLGREILCTNYGLLSWLYDVLGAWGKERGIIQLIISILFNLSEDFSKNNTNIFSLIVTSIIDDGFLPLICKNRADFDEFVKVVLNIFDINSKFITIDQLKVLISISEDSYCTYLLEYGCDFSICIKENNVTQKLVKKWFNKN